MITQEENLVRLLRQMKDQGFTNFVISNVVPDGELNIFGDGVESQTIHVPQKIMNTLSMFLLRHKQPFSISKIIGDIEHDYVGPDKGLSGLIVHTNQTNCVFVKVKLVKWYLL